MLEISYTLQLYLPVAVKKFFTPSRIIPAARAERNNPVNLVMMAIPHLVTLPPGCIHASHPHTPGTEEYITILSGSVTVTAGANKAQLNCGDVIAFQTDVEHALENHSDIPAELYMVIRFQ